MSRLNAIVWAFRQDSYPNHTSKMAKKWSANNIIRVLEWTAQFLDLKFVGRHKKKVAKEGPINNKEL